MATTFRHSASAPAVPLTSKMERKSKPKKSDDRDDDVRVALLRQLGVAEDDLKLLLAADAVKVNDGGSDDGRGVCGLSPFRAFCRKVENVNNRVYQFILSFSAKFPIYSKYMSDTTVGN